MSELPLNTRHLCGHHMFSENGYNYEEDCYIDTQNWIIVDYLTWIYFVKHGKVKTKYVIGIIEYKSMYGKMLCFLKFL